MISVTDLRAGAAFEEKGQYFLVLSYEHSKIARGSGNVKVKVRNLETGATIDKTFNTGARVQEATLSRKKAQYLYNDSAGFYFMDPVFYEQFTVDRKLVSDSIGSNLFLDELEKRGVQVIPASGLIRIKRRKKTNG